MKSYNITTSNQSLIIRRKRERAILPLLIIGTLLCLMLVIPLTGVFVYHYFVWGNVWLAIFVTLLFLPMIIGDARYLGKKLIILDKLHNQVTVDGLRVYALEDVIRVMLGSYIVPNVKNQPFRFHGLYLEMANGDAVELERLTLAGPMRRDLEEVGLMIANFAHIKSNLSEDEV